MMVITGDFNGIKYINHKWDYCIMDYNWLYMFLSYNIDHTWVFSRERLSAGFFE